MTPPRGPVDRLHAARATGQQIADLIEEIRLVAWWPHGADADGFGADMPQVRVNMLRVLLDQAVRMCDSPEDRNWLIDARAAGRQIAELIRGREGLWWMDRRTGQTLVLCLRLAEYLASASSRDEAEHLVKMLNKTVYRASPSYEPAGDHDRLQAARATGRHIEEMIKESGLGGWQDEAAHHSATFCLRMAHYLATAGSEGEAELLSTLLAQAISRHTQHLSQAVGDTAAARLEVARTIGRQVVELIRRTDLAWFTAEPAFRPLRDCLDAADKLANAASEVDAERFATVLGQVIRRCSPVLAAHRPSLSSDLQVMACQTDRIAHGFVSGGRQWLERAEISSPRELPPVVHRPTLMYLAVEYRRPKELVRKWAQGAHDPGPIIRHLLRLAVATVPVPVQARYAEEYGAEILHLRGEPSWRRIMHALRLARGAWRVRGSLRKAGTALWTMPPEEN
jgi:hypothetical protein